MRNSQILRSTLLAVTGIVAAGAITPLRVQSQSAATNTPAFEVASVKPTKTTGIALFQILPGGRFRATNFSLQGLITRAWRIQQSQVEGGPNWIRSEGYDIEAKAEGDPAADQLWLMVRTLLIERFKLSIRTETRELPVYELIMARKDGKPGPALRQFSDANCRRAAPTGGPVAPFDVDRPTCGALYSPTGHWIGRDTTIESLTSELTRVMGRPVSNRTGLTGRFDLDLQWTDLAQLLQPENNAPPPADGPSFPTALQEQLGLKLESTKGPVDVLVIDHVEHPTED
jgi:uncharacterized protein (TIGR03435 family)